MKFTERMLEAYTDCDMQREIIQSAYIIVEMEAAIRAAIEISDRTLPQYEGRSAENQEVYDQCAAALAKLEALASE